MQAGHPTTSIFSTSIFAVLKLATGSVVHSENLPETSWIVFQNPYNSCTAKKIQLRNTEHTE